MKASLAKEILSAYNDNDEIAFVIYDYTDLSLAVGKDITLLQYEKILTIIQNELCSCIDEDLCNTILKEL